MNKSGSSVVFLVIALAGLMSVTLTLIYAARHNSEISIADGAINLAGVSVLSKYDYYVEKEYALFLIKGSNSELSKSLSTYSGMSASVNAERYNTVNLEPIQKQILDYMKNSGISNTLSKAENSEDTESLSDRVLKHEPTIISLPSRSLPDKSIIISAKNLAENLKNPNAIFKSGTKKYLLDSYILNKFNNSEKFVSDEHFFSSEVEYVIGGLMSDSKNKKRVDLALKALRTGLNLAHIYSDPEKSSVVAAAAEVITPGVFGTVTQAGIASVWAAAEAVNDVNLLHKGYKVPLIKDAYSWAVDLDALIDGYNAENGCILPATNKGLVYDDYLRVLLFIKDDNIKTARILDLIQINMRKNYDSDFLIQEHAAGISIEVNVHGKNLSYDKIY